MAKPRTPKYNCAECRDSGVVPVGRDLYEPCPSCRQRIDPDVVRDYVDEAAAQQRMRRSSPTATT